MQAIEVVKPVVVDGVQFYVSNDGTKSGVSINGLSRLCGVDLGGISRLMSSLDALTKTAPKQLEHLRGKVFVDGLKGEATGGFDQAKIVDFKAAARIIRYYAYESKAANGMAALAYDRFAEMGLDRWIKQVTGYQEAIAPTTDPNLIAILTQLMGKVETIERDQKQYMAVIKLYPTVEALTLDAIANTLESAERYTIKEWLELEHSSIELNKSQYFRLCSAISLAVKALQGNYAETRLNAKNVPVRVYRQSHFKLMTECLKQIEANQY